MQINNSSFDEESSLLGTPATTVDRSVSTMLAVARNRGGNVKLAVLAGLIMAFFGMVVFTSVSRNPVVSPMHLQAEPSNFITYKGVRYATLDNRDPYSESSYWTGFGWTAVPSGWSIAKPGPDAQYVVNNNKWNCLIVVCEGGQAYATTVYQSMGAGKDQGLDKTLLNCGGGNVYKSFSPGYNVLIQKPFPEPTMSPISNPTFAPTLVPISDPTTEPSPVPISDPTLSPISTPTAEPSPVPIADPTFSPISDPTFAPSPSPVSDPTLAPVTSKNIRAFIFIKGVTPEVPPAGVVLVADKDINYLKNGEFSNAAYIVGPATAVDGVVLAEDALLNTVSTIVPGPDTEATFYSGENLSGHKHTFTPKKYQALTNFHYLGSSAGGNDKANSIFVSSTVDAHLPEVALRTRMF